MKIAVFGLSLLFICSHAIATESISSNDDSYRNVCLKIAEDPWYFQNFRSLQDYAHIVEGPEGSQFAEYLNTYASTEIRERYDTFEKLECIGNPRRTYYPGIGKFSGTTLRYIIVANQMRELFALPNNATVVEIGAGFGGQSYILSQIQSFANYYIYDLPEVEAFINKILGILQVDHVTCLPMECELPEESIDLVISNYAFSECTRETQLDYFDRVIKKSKRGYMIYNQIAGSIFGLDYLSPNEFITLLQQNGKNPQVYNEPVVTHPDNILIVWDTTK